MTDIPEVSEVTVRTALQAVLDPELGENIVDLGLVLRIEIAPARVHVVLIPTSATCPMSALLLEDATDAVQRACPLGTAVDVVLDWDATWGPERLSPALKSSFGW
jgi:metal-sulfur cluster biosynthetic enzyme